MAKFKTLEEYVIFLAEERRIKNEDLQRQNNTLAKDYRRLFEDYIQLKDEILSLAEMNEMRWNGDYPATKDTKGNIDVFNFNSITEEKYPLLYELFNNALEVLKRHQEEKNKQ